MTETRTGPTPRAFFGDAKPSPYVGMVGPLSLINALGFNNVPITIPFPHALAQLVTMGTLVCARRCLAIDNIIHRNADSPLNPYARVFSSREVTQEFTSFELIRSYSRYMHAPPLPVRRVPAERWLGCRLWVHLRARLAVLEDELSGLPSGQMSHVRQDPFSIDDRRCPSRVSDTI